MAWWRKQSAQTPAWNLEDYHTAFTATIQEQIEQGVAPWQKSWKPGARRLPEHLVSGNAYRGVNALYLSVAQTAKGYRDKPLGDRHADPGAGWSGPPRRAGDARPG